jgi:anion-transporting  ArsA/GET3 family ATPase
VRNDGYAGGVSDLAKLVAEKKVIVCCGAGGVGKTTTAAAIGLAGARLGRRVLVLTIDPAKRLAQAMGLSQHMREPAPVTKERLAEAGVTTGTLDAWMLNPDVVFESLVRRMAPTRDQADRILASRLFRHLSELVAGMQEYTAAEALYELSSSPAWAGTGMSSCHLRLNLTPCGSKRYQLRASASLPKRDFAP